MTMRQRIVSPRALRYLLAALILVILPAQGKSLQCQQAVKPVDGFFLGVQDGQVLHLYMADQGHWQREPAMVDFQVPADAKGLHFNERKIGVVRGQQVYFYEGPVLEGEAWPDAGRMPLPKLQAGDAIVNGLYSTERELMVVGPTRASSFSEDGEQVVARYSGVLPSQIDCLFDMLYGQLAVVADGQVRVYQLTAGSKGQPYGLKLVPAMTYPLPQGGDEVTVLQFQYLGIREGQKLHFLTYDGKAKAWKAAPDIPDFDLDTRNSLPVHKED